MKISAVSVEFKKTVSDRDYGNETASVRIDAELEDGEVQTGVTELLTTARHWVLRELNQSESINIRRAINPPPRICNECGEPLPDESRNYLHPDCEQKMRAEREASRASQLVRAGGMPDEEEESPF